MGIKCTPARRERAGASVQKEAKCAPAVSRCPRRRGNRIKNARRRGEDRQGPACKRRQIARRQCRDVQGGGETGRKMHAGEARTGRGQRANGGRLRAGSVEMSKAAGKRDKNARRRDEERQRPACKRRQNAHRQCRDVQGGGETRRKMHAGEAEKGRSQRANGGKLPAVIVETSKLAGKREEKCTPARRERAGASVQTEADCAPSSSRRPRRRRNRIKNARRRDEERQRPACKRRQFARQQCRDVQGGGEMGRKMHAGEMKKGRGQRANGGRLRAVNVETSKAAGKRDKNARRRGEDRQGPACKRRQIARRQRRDVQGGGETG